MSVRYAASKRRPIPYKNQNRPHIPQTLLNPTYWQDPIKPQSQISCLQQESKTVAISWPAQARASKGQIQAKAPNLKEPDASYPFPPPYQ
ncbi:MAG TPA: hypothetical protein DDW52_13360 [Planctomycetaceae bacterium]|nr:hypothetical protein [Planctomycetaceae bacterium]